ncbi:MAG: amino acid adenylation domain-containing protein, partial [Sedimenticolaceae bacterium]
YVGGVTFDWDRFDANYSRRSVTLPTYPFQRKRYWFETKKKVNVGSLSESISTKELGLAREGSETGLYELQWETKSRASLTLIKPGEVGSWLIFADQSNLGEEIAKLLVEQGECCNLIFPNNNKASNSESSSRQIIDPANPQDYIELLRCHSNNQYPLKGVIYLWPLDLNVTSLDAPLKETYLLGCGSVLNLIQAMAKVKGKGKNQPHLWLTTRGTQEVYDNVETTVLNVQQSSLWGLGRVIGLELPELKCVRMDLDFQPSEDEALVICTELLHSDKEDQIVWRNRQNQRYVARLRYVQHSAKEDLPQQLLGTESCPQIKKQRSYLITGGLGTLGLRAAEWLIAQGARHLVLVGRSGSSLQAKKAIAQIKKAGVHIETKKLDISDFKACNKLLNDFGSKFPALGGLIHAAGVLEDGILMQQDWSQFETVMKPKILGAWNLHQLTTGQALDFFWCFSSISSVLGSPGQGNYAAANAFMDTLMHHRHQSGLSGLSINWGPWDQTSMVSDIGSTGKIQMAARGIQLLALNQGEDLFNQLLITESAQVMVANIDWSLLRQNLPVQLQSLPMFLALDNSSLEEVNSSSYSLLTVGKDGLINYLRDTMAKVLGYEPLSVDVNSSLIELGIDSLMALSLRSNVIQNTGVEIPIDILVARPTNIKSIATFLLDEMAANSGTSQDDSALPDIIPIPEGQEIPLSFAQQRLWFIDQLMGGESTVYNMPIVLRLQGKANVDALGQALADLVKRHDSLRMTFVSKGEIEEVELLSAYEPLELDDISAIAEEEQEALVRSKTEDYLGQSFKLDQGPLFKARLLVLGEEEHVLLANMHHIISDGWSMGVLIRDFVSLYQSRDTGLASTLTPLAIQYQDYAYWQRQWLSGDVLQKQLDYWKGKLTGAPELLELPTDRARPAQQSYRGAQVSSHLPKSMLDALNQLGKEQGTTLFMTLLAAFNVLLNRYSHQDDICVGSPIANRNHPGTEDQVGFFVNTLVLRSQFEGIETFEDLLQQTKKTCLEAYAHQDVPFEQLVEELQPTRNAAINPLFQVMFALQNAPMDDIELPELRLAFVENESLISRFDLTIEVTETEAGLYLRWEYNSDLFDAWRIEKMGEHFALLLEGIAQDSEQVLVLPLLTESEQQSLVKWNDTAVDYPKDQTIIDLFREQARQHPNNTAVVFEETQLSYQELDERSNQLARYLLSQEGVKGEHNPLIAICVERSLEMIVGLLGILKAGGAYVPLDPGYPEERLAYMLEDSGAKLLLTQKNLTSPLSKYSGTLVHLDADWKIIGRRSNTPLKKAIDPNDLAYVIYTSGSTGRPKGVAVEHRQLNNFIFYFSKEISISKEDRLLAVTTLSFDIAGLEFYLPLSCGAQVVLLGKQEASDTNRIEVTLEHNKITLMQATPATWTMLQAGDWKNTQSIKILCGGEALSNSLATYLVGQSKDVWNLYGPTETVIWSASHRLIKGESFESIGTPISNTQIYMLDEGNQISPIGVAGELCIAGAGLARGYFNRPELTAEKFIYLGIHLETLETCPDEEIEDKAKDKEGFVRTRLYRTGDLARWLPDGNIEYLGRTDFQVKIRGFRIELGEIESRLLEHRDIREAVVGVTGEDEHKQLVAWVVVNDNAEEPDAEGLHPFLKENLPDYMVPAFYVPLDALPLTPNGKLDRKALPAPDGELFVHQYVAPSTATEELLAGIWQDLLGQEQVGIHDNFFERGGHSLIATQLVSRIRECFDIEFPLKGVFEFAQLKEMAANLDSSQYDSALPDIVPMPAGQVIPLSFAQQRLWFIDQLMGGESTVYNMPLALRMQGMVNVEALQQSFSDLVSRHDSLRMTFVTAKESGHAEQSGEVVLLPAFEPLERKDLSDLSADKQASTVQEQATSYLDQAFDLQSGPLFKARLLTLSEDEHVLLVNMHHIISDGWSMGILIRDLTALYQSRLDDTVSTPSPLAIQYQDYAYWQRQWLSGEILEQQLAYWKQQLQGAPELLELPTDRARPARQSYRGAAFESRISRETLDKLNQLSQKQGVTLFMTLLTAFNVLLRRHSGQDDICVGSPIANRHQPGTESQVGFFVNTLVLRSQFEGIETFEELLQQVHQTCLDAYSHQDVPFEQLVEELQPTRNMAINPLFQVMFVLQNTPDGGLSEEELGALADIALSTLDQEDAGARSLFDLTLSAAETEEGLFLEWEYNTDIFDE